MAVYHEFQTVLSFPAAADLSGFQFYPVALTTAGTLTTIGSTATKPIGVLQDTPNAAGTMAAVVIAGPSKMVAYTGAIVAGTSVFGVSANGVGEVTTTDNRWVIGDALEGAADDGSNGILEVLVNVKRY